MWAIGKWIIDSISERLDTVSAKLSAITDNTAASGTASKTGTLSQKLAYAFSLLENGTYGLSAINTKMSSGAVPVVKSVQSGTVAESTGSSGANDTVTITTASVNVGKCSVRLFPAITTGSASAFSQATFVYRTGFTSTVLTVSRQPFYAQMNSSIYPAFSWEIIEYY